MTTTIEMLVVGDVPEAFELPKHVHPFELHLTRVASLAELNARLEHHDYSVAVSASGLEGSDATSLVRRLKQDSPRHPVLMVGDPEEADALLDACDAGLDEILIRCQAVASTTRLLARTVRRWLERVTSGSTAASPHFKLALRRVEHKLEEQLQETEKMRLVGQLAGGVAHDFNNLLTIITSYTHYVLGELGEDSPHAFALEKVLNAAQRGSSLTDQLLAFNRRRQSQPQSLDLSCVIDELFEMLDRLLRPHVKLVVGDDQDPARVWIDRGQLEQVLFNLVINARDAMSEGGTLTLSTRQLALERPLQTRFDVIPTGSYGVLEVRDTGHGIAPDVIEHIFEPFFTTKGVGGGTGLGLASAWGIVKHAGGFIDVDTTVGEGTSFTLFLPISEETTTAEPAEPPKESTVACSATVLLVEDDLEVREALRRFLDRRGFRILEAASGAEALECARDYKDIIDILLTDVIMPGMSGRDLAGEFGKERPDTHVFLMTGYAGDRISNLDTRWELLNKPIDLDDLARRLEAALE